MCRVCRCTYHQSTILFDFWILQELEFVWFYHWVCSREDFPWKKVNLSHNVYLSLGVYRGLWFLGRTLFLSSRGIPIDMTGSIFSLTCIFQSLVFEDFLHEQFGCYLFLIIVGERNHSPGRVPADNVCVFCLFQRLQHHYKKATPEGNS